MKQAATDSCTAHKRKERNLTQEQPGVYVTVCPPIYRADRL